MTVGSVALRNSIEPAVTGLNFFLPCLRRKLRIATDTSPNSAKCWMETPRRVCSSYRNASISSDAARILLRGEYSRLARGTWVLHTGLHLPQGGQPLIKF